MSTKLTYTGAEVQELLDKIEKGDFDNAKTLEGHPASYFAIASEFTSLAESFATEQGRISALYSYFNNGSANNALKLGGQLPTYYATATQYEILQRTLSDFKSLFDSMFEKDSDGNIHAKLSLWSSGGITAGGVGSGGSGGGGISYNRLDAWADYSADKAGYVLSALLGKDLDNRVSALANAGYITQSALAPYALRSEIPSLGGYASQSWVGENYLSKSGGTLTDALTVKGSGSPLTVHRTQPLASVVKFVNTDGNLGWLGVDIDKTAIFMEASGVINKLLHSGNYADYITNSYLKSTLGISDWALASVKPTYTASEVGALAQDSSSANADLDTILDSRTAVLKPFFQNLTNNNVGSARKGVLRMSYNGSESQLLFDHYNRLLRYRTIGENPKDWATLAFASDIPTKLSQLTDDVVAGKYLLLSGGTLSGSNRDLLSLDTSNTSGPRILLHENGNLIALIGCVPKQTTTDYGAYFVNVSSKFGVILGNDKKAYITLNTDTMSKDYQILHSGNYSDYALSKYGGTVNGSITASSFRGNLTGNADSASCVTGTANYANVALGENKVRLISNQTGNVGDFPKSWVSGLSVMSNYVGWQMVSYAGVDANPYFRKIADTGTWSEWKELAFLDDITGGMADYYGSRVASANVEFTDSAVRKLISTSSMTISKPPADGSILHFAWDNDGGWNHQLFLGSSSAVPPEQRMAWRAQWHRTWGEWKSLLFEDSNTITPSSGLLTVTGQANITTSLTTPVITTNSLTIGGVTLTYDSVNEALCINGNMYALGGITAGGAGISAYTSLEARVARLEQQLNIS